jgi:hypothetical protein
MLFARIEAANPGSTQMSILANDFFGFDPSVFIGVYLWLHLAFRSSF